MAMRSGDDYLWDGSGPPDEDVRALEEALRPLAHDGRPLAWNALHRNRPRWPWMLAAALIAAAGGAFWAGGAFRDDGRGTGRDAVSLTIVRDGRALATEEWFTASEDNRELRLSRDGDWLGDLSLDPGSRLRVDGVSEQEASLYLAERGRMEALVSADARPRFFQVGTPAARCIDLGCQYVLQVDEVGTAHVVVTTGWVAFQFDESGRQREVFVPRGAECRATRDHGPGTPRFTDTEIELVALLDAFDGELRPDRRRDLAGKICSFVDSERDTLVLYHLMQDEDPVVSAAAEERLVDIAGMPPGATQQKMVRVDPGLWLDHLRWLWH